MFADSSRGVPLHWVATAHPFDGLDVRHVLRLASDGQSKRHPVAVQAPWEKLRVTRGVAGMNVR